MHNFLLFLFHFLTSSYPSTYACLRWWPNQFLKTGLVTMCCKIYFASHKTVSCSYLCSSNLQLPFAHTPIWALDFPHLFSFCDSYISHTFLLNTRTNAHNGIKCSSEECSIALKNLLELNHPIVGKLSKLRWNLIAADFSNDYHYV